LLKALLLQYGLFTLACSMSLVGYAMADEPRLVNVPAGDLVTALETLAQQSGAELIYQAAQLKGLTTKGVHGVLSVHDAVTLLLSGTKLKVTTDKGGAMMISAPAQTDGTSDLNPGSGHDSKGASSGSGKRTTVGSIPDKLSEDDLQVLITAQKLEQRLQDVPIAVTAIKADALVDTTLLRAQDYYAAVPGLTVVPVAEGTYQSLSIRGIATGNYAGNPPVGVTVDDVPVGSATLVGGGGGREIPDIDPGELSRVEVLRGPQGTLYGTSSMGGLLKFVTVDPSSDRLSGRLEEDIDSVYNGAELGYGLRGAVNAPLGDTLAVRASAFTRRDPGYIDNPILHLNGVNEQRVSGGRFAALWQPNATLSLKLSALMQDTAGAGTADVDVLPGLKDLQQDYMRGSGAHDRRLYAYSATLRAQAGSVELTSVTGYNVTSLYDSSDDSWLNANTSEALFGVAGSTYIEHNTIRKLSQEIRVSAAVSRRLNLLFASYYTHERSHGEFDYRANDLTTGAVVGESLFQTNWSRYQEVAAFSDLTISLTDRMEVQVGGRISHIEQALRENDFGPSVFSFDGVPSPFIGPEREVSSNPFTYLVTPQFRVSSDLMIYARLASGYRAGGINVFGTSTGLIPPIYRPDTTIDYEVGVKGSVLDQRLRFDASLYHIDWHDFQILFLNPVNVNGAYVGNGSQARSQGVELSVEAQPFTGLKVSAWAAWDDAALTKSLPPVSAGYGLPGDRLPYSSRFSGNVSLEETFYLVKDFSGYIAGTLSYVGMREGEFASALLDSTQRQVFPAYAKSDLRIGARSDSWKCTLFVDNVTDKRGLIAGGLGSYPPFGFVYIRPRMIGLSLVKLF